MLFDELEQLERREKQQDPREERRLIPIDSCSQSGTGFTGRSDFDPDITALERYRRAEYDKPRIP